MYDEQKDYFFAVLEFELQGHEDEIEALRHALISYKEVYLKDDEE